MAGIETVAYNGWATFFGEVTLLVHYGPAEVTRGFVSTVKGIGPIIVTDGHAVFRGKWGGIDVRTADLALALRRALAGDATDGISGHHVWNHGREFATITVRPMKASIEVSQNSATFSTTRVARFEHAEVPALIDFLDRHPAES